MENIGIDCMMKELKLLNPKAHFTVEFEPDVTIISDVPVEKLVLPANYYYNSKNGITNKHRTRSGLYECFDFNCKPEIFVYKRKKSLLARVFA